MLGIGIHRLLEQAARLAPVTGPSVSGPGSIPQGRTHAAVVVALEQAGWRPLECLDRIAGAIECEKLKIVAKSPDTQTEEQSGALSDGDWSGGAQLFVRGNKPGDFVGRTSVNEPRKLPSGGSECQAFSVLPARRR
jgi:hypothetical protein